MIDEDATPADGAPLPRPIRPWTPDQRLVLPSGESGRRIAVKRACSTCGEKIGDVTDNELVASMNVRNRRIGLLSVEGECWKCRGVHAVFADPEPRRERWREDDGDVWTIKLLCPGKQPGEPVMKCASWQQCGCVPPSAPLTTVFEEFLDRPCPASPTGSHAYLPEKGYVGAPTGPCIYLNCRDNPVAAEDWVTEPGVYAVQPVLVEADRLGFDWVDLRQRDATPAVG